MFINNIFCTVMKWNIIIEKNKMYIIIISFESKWLGLQLKVIGYLLKNWKEF